MTKIQNKTLSFWSAARIPLFALCLIAGGTGCQEKNSATGLMFRDSLPEDHGMLFVFEKPKTASFWMKNTKIPLSIAYIDSAGRILQIESMKPLDETPVESTSSEVAFALEVNEGWFTRNRVSAGAKISGIRKE